jgi:hypothetical protein
MVADAVCPNRSPQTGFPVYQGKIRETSSFWTFCARCPPANVGNSSVYRALFECGIRELKLRKQGNLVEPTGKSSKPAGSSAVQFRSAKKPARISKKVELGGEPATFKGVAELIVRDPGDVEWLAAGLRNWVWPQERWPTFLRNPESDRGMFKSMTEARWSRSKLIKALGETLPEAVDTLSDLLKDFAFASFIADEQLGRDFGPLQRVHLLGLLHEVKRRSQAISRYPAFVSESGKTKAGRNIPLAPDQIDERVACASAVNVAREMLTKAPLTIRQASKAAHLLYELGIAPAGRCDLVGRISRWSSDPLPAWTPYFRKAREPHPMLEKLNGMLADQLKGVRDCYARNSAAAQDPVRQAE